MTRTSAMFASKQPRRLDESALAKRSLATILRSHGSIPVVDAVDIALDICDELASAHAHGVVHGDLGLHRVRAVWPALGTGHHVEIFTLGEVGSAPFGIAHLVPPEQRLGRVVDPRADIWTIGALLLCMIAGPSAFPSGHLVRLGPRDLARLAASGSPQALNLVIRACLEEDLAKRIPSGDALSEALASFAASPPRRYEQLVRRRAGYGGSTKDVASMVVRTARVAAPEAPTTAWHRPVDDQAVVATRVVHREEARPAATTPAAVRSTAVLRGPAVQGRPRGRSSSSVGPVVLTPEVRHAISRTIDPPTPRSSWGSAVVYASAVVAIALGVGLGMHLMDRVMDNRGMQSPSNESALAGRTPSASGALPSRRPEPSSSATPMMTPTALPDVPPTAPSSLPDAHRASPSRASMSAAAPKPILPRPASRTTPAASASGVVTVTPASLDSALR